jgi:arylsulfatase A-like enzyme
MMRSKLLAFTCSAALVFFVAACRGHIETEGYGPSVPAPADQRPNILVVIADDMGYSDISPFGGEISTPSLQRLADRGARFTNFRVHTVCTPTRAMLLTGANNHVAGIGAMAGEWRGQQEGAVGYEAFLTDRVVTIAQLMSDSGYDTFISGKWDIGGRSDPSLLPAARGFKHSFVLVEGSADHFREAPALQELDAIHYQEDGQPFTLPEGFYSSDFYTDKLLAYLDEIGSEPYFAVLAFTAPHWPLQAQDEYLARYEDVYSVGYDEIRNARIDRMRDMGILAADIEPAPAEDIWPKWDDLSEPMKKLEARRMQTYAAMVESMDHNIGRILDELEQSGRLDNTVVVFLSDNGATGANPLDFGPGYPRWAEETYNNEFQNLGRANSFVWTGPGWAHVSNAPYKLYKGFPAEGGIASPLIVSAPSQGSPGRIVDGFSTITDLSATILDLAEVDHPGSEYKGRRVAPLEGKSMGPLLDGEVKEIRNQQDTMVWEIFGRRAVRMGKWKAVAINQPWGRGANDWQLYDLSKDPTELNDISGEFPEIVEEAKSRWDEYAKDNGVVFDPYADLVWTNTVSHYDWHPEDWPPE